MFYIYMTLSGFILHDQKGQLNFRVVRRPINDKFILEKKFYRSLPLQLDGHFIFTASHFTETSMMLSIKLVKIIYKHVTYYVSCIHSGSYNFYSYFVILLNHNFLKMK